VSLIIKCLTSFTGSKRLSERENRVARPVKAGSQLIKLPALANGYRRDFARSSPVWMSRFRHFSVTSTTAQAGNSPTNRTSQLVYDATRNAAPTACTPRVGQSTVCESHHSDMLPSCHSHSSQKTRRRWSNCGDGYPKLKFFQSSSRRKRV
jgi:hypothetical protein